MLNLREQLNNDNELCSIFALSGFVPRLMDDDLSKAELFEGRVMFHLRRMQEKWGLDLAAWRLMQFLRDNNGRKLDNI